MENTENVYRMCRGPLSREKASEGMNNYISTDRMFRIEHGATPYPDEVLEMAKYYNRPDLCNHYCANECAIGQKVVPEVKEKSLANITLEMLATLNRLEQEKNRLIEITADGEISEDEMQDFSKITEECEHISMAIYSLNLWRQKNGLDDKLEK